MLARKPPSEIFPDFFRLKNRLAFPEIISSVSSSYSGLNRVPPKSKRRQNVRHREESNSETSANSGSRVGKA